MRHTIYAIAIACALAAGCKKKDDGKSDEATKSGETEKGDPQDGDQQDGDQPADGDKTADRDQPAGDGKTLGLEGGGKQVAGSAVATKVGTVIAAVEVAEEEAASHEAAKPGVPENALALMEGQTFEDKGDFKVQIENDGGAGINQKVKAFLEETAGKLNQAIKLPRDIPIIMKECGQVNAFYNGFDHVIIMCTEFGPDAVEKFKLYKKDEAVIEKMALNVVISVFFHELGHALIGEWSLPATGREEDSADQLAAFALIGESDESDQVILDAAEYWLVSEIQRGEFGRNNWSDEHSLDQVRSYNLGCWVFGSKPSKYEALLVDYDVPLRRAGRCEKEYRDLKAAWSALLEKVMIQG